MKLEGVSWGIPVDVPPFVIGKGKLAAVRGHFTLPTNSPFDHAAVVVRLDEFKKSLLAD